MIQLTEARIKELLKAERKLNALEAGGVDNWEWYSESLAEIYKEDEIEAIVREFVEHDLHDNYLVEDTEVDFPAGRDAGPSINLTRDGIESMVQHLLKMYAEIKQVEKDYE